MKSLDKDVRTHKVTTAPIPQHLRPKNTSKQKMTTFWVSPTTWEHVKNKRELGETIDECLQRLLGIVSRTSLEICVVLRGEPGSGKTYYLTKIAKLLGDDGFDMDITQEPGVESLKGFKTTRTVTRTIVS